MSRFRTILAASRSLSLSRTKFASFLNSLDLVAVTGSGQRALCTTCLLNKAEDRRSMMASLPKKDEGTQGDKSADIDASHLTRSMFPDEDTPNLLFDGVRFQDLPICHIKCSLNNTILALTDGTGKPVAMKSGVSVTQIPHLTPALFLSGGKFLLGAHFTFSQTGN
ncbi:unnamed protein product [Ixodes pacificus]